MRKIFKFVSGFFEFTDKFTNLWAKIVSKILNLRAKFKQKRFGGAENTAVKSIKRKFNAVCLEL